MGSIGTSTSTPRVTFELDTREKLQSLSEYKKDIKEQMQWALDDVQKSINDIMRRSFFRVEDVDQLWEAIHDYYPQSLPGYEADKILLTNREKQLLVGVEIRLHDDYNGKITATLNPFTVPFSDFTKQELYDYFGIEEE